MKQHRQEAQVFYGVTVIYQGVYQQFTQIKDCMWDEWVQFHFAFLE